MIDKTNNQLPEELLKKRCVDMTGGDIFQIITAAIHTVNNPATEPPRAERLVRGYKALAEFLHCSVPTACRMVVRNDIHAPAVMKSGKTILFNVDLVLEQLNELGSRWNKVNKNHKKT